MLSGEVGNFVFESLDFSLGQRIGQPECDKLDFTVLMPVRKVTGRNSNFCTSVQEGGFQFHFLPGLSGWKPLIQGAISSKAR